MKTKHLFSRHPFHTDVQLLLDDSEGPIPEQRWTTVIKRLQQRFIYANRNRICWDFNKKPFPQFTEKCPKFPASSGEFSCGESRTSRWTTPGDPPTPHPCLSGNKRKLRLHLTQTPQTGSGRDQNRVVCSDESPSLSPSEGVGALRMWSTIHPLHPSCFSIV